MAKVLLHTLVFSPDGVSTGYLMTDLALQLRRLGHSLTVLTTTPHYNVDPDTAQRQPLRKHWSGLFYESELGGVRVIHVPMPRKGERVSARMLDYIRFHLASLALAVVKVPAYEIVIAPSPPLTIGFVAWLLGVWRWAPSVYNVQELYPDAMINQGMLRNPALIWLLRKLERFIYARSAMVVPISDWFKRILRQRQVPKRKLTIIPNFVDGAFFRPLPRDNAFARAHGLVDDFVVLYAGNIGLTQDWETLLGAARTLAHLPIRFVVVGDGARRNWLAQETQKRGLANVTLLEYQPRDVVPLIYASSDLGTIPLLPGAGRDTFPSKIYTIMACGKSVLAQSDGDSELDFLIRQARCGRVIPPGNPVAYAEAVLAAYSNRDELTAEGERGRQCIEGEYSKEVVVQKYDALIRQLVGR